MPYVCVYFPASASTIKHSYRKLLPMVWTPTCRSTGGLTRKGMVSKSTKYTYHFTSLSLHLLDAAPNIQPSKIWYYDSIPRDDSWSSNWRKGVTTCVIRSSAVMRKHVKIYQSNLYIQSYLDSVQIHSYSKISMQVKISNWTLVHQKCSPNVECQHPSSGHWRKT